MKLHPIIRITFVVFGIVLFSLFLRAPVHAATLYVSNDFDNAIGVLDSVTHNKLTTIPVGTEPRPIVYNSLNNRMYVGNTYSHDVSVIDPTTNTVVATIALGANIDPLTFALSHNKTRLYAANFGSTQVSVIDTTTNTLLTTIDGFSNPQGMVLSNDDSKLYVANQNCCSSNGFVSVVDTSTNAITQTIPVGHIGSVRIALTPDGTKAYVADDGGPNAASYVSVIDTTTNTVTKTISIGDNPSEIVVNPAGTRAYVLSTYYWYGGSTLSVNGTVSVIDTATDSVITTIPVGHVPNESSLSNDGSMLYVVNNLDNSISVVDTLTNAVTDTIPNVGNSLSTHPWGVALLETSATSPTPTTTPPPTATPTPTPSLVCGVCPPGTILAGRAPEFGTNSPGQQCQDVGVGAPNAIYCSYNSSGACTDPVPQPPYCAQPTATPTPTPQPDQPPAILSIPAQHIPVGSTYPLFDGQTTVRVQFTDPDSSSWTATVDYGDGSGPQNFDVNSGLGHTYTTAGSYTVTVAITDNQGQTGTRTTTVLVGDVCMVCPQGTVLAGRAPEFGIHNPAQACQDVGIGTPTSVYCDFDRSTQDCTHPVDVPPYCPVTNHPPVADAGGSYTVDEGGMVQLSGSGTDADGDALTYKWDLNNDGTYETTGQSANYSAVDGPSTQQATLQVCDTHNACSTDIANIAVNNVAPSISAITVSTSPTSVNTTVSASASFTDPGVLDTHVASWSWGDTTTSAGIVSELNGSGSVTGSHIYSAAGVYTVTLTVTDKDGGVGIKEYQYVVIYDPNGGFVTGAGQINSPVGAEPTSPDATGKAMLGINAKYNTGDTVPKGSLKFMFRNGGFDFTSTSYDWMTVSGSEVFLQGHGQINGGGDYTFVASMIDGAPDTFRIKIYDNTTVYYDNQIGDNTYADPTQALSVGQIKVQQ